MCVGGGGSSLFYCAVGSGDPSFAIISLEKRDSDSVAFLCLPSDAMWLLVFCVSSSCYI